MNRILAQPNRAVPFALFGAACLVLATVWMRAEKVELPPLRSVLVDVSASATRVSPDFSSRVRKTLETEARAAEEQGEEFLVVLAGSRVRLAFGPGSPASFRELLRGEEGEPFDPLASGDSGSGTNLAAGLRFVRRILASSPSRPASLMILGDGSHTGESPLPPLRQLISMGVSWRGATRWEPGLSELALSELQVPRELEPGAPLLGSLAVTFRAGMRGLRESVEIEVMAKDGEGARSATIDLRELAEADPAERPGSSITRRYRFELGPVRRGRTVVSARLLTSSGATTVDPISENDRVDSVVLAGKPLVVGWLVAPELDAQLRRFTAALPLGFSSRFLTTSELAAALPGLDALVVFDRSLEDLPSELCQSFVQAGGGLFVAGGFDLLSGWDSVELEELAELLPLRLASDTPNGREVLVLVDGSGSMEGEPFERVREAVAELVRSAPREDQIELGFFTVALHKTQQLRGVGDELGSGRERERVARELMNARVPGGTTRILESLEELASAREQTDSDALVFLLTDGREAIDVEDPEQRALELRGRLAASNTELIVFAVGADANVEFLRGLVSDEDKLYVGDRSSDLADLFRREVNRERVREAAAIPVELRSGPLARELLATDLEPASLSRLIRTERRATAETVLVSDRGEPVLAVQRVGRGRTMLMTSMPFADWGPEWSARLGDWVPALRWCARRTEDGAGLGLEVEEGRLVLRGVAPETPLVLFGRVDARGTGVESGEREPLLFALPTDGAGVGSSEVRSAEIPAWLASQAAESRTLQFESMDGERLFSLPLSAGRNPEFTEPRSLWELGSESPSEGPGRSPDVEISSSADLSPMAQTTGPTAIGLMILGASSIFLAGWTLCLGSRRQGVGHTDR